MHRGWSEGERASVQSEVDSITSTAAEGNFRPWGVWSACLCGLRVEFAWDLMSVRGVWSGEWTGLL